MTQLREAAHILPLVEAEHAVIPIYAESSYDVEPILAPVSPIEAARDKLADAMKTSEVHEAALEAADSALRSFDAWHTDVRNGLIGLQGSLRTKLAEVRTCTSELLALLDTHESQKAQLAAKDQQIQSGQTESTMLEHTITVLSKQDDMKQRRYNEEEDILLGAPSQDPDELNR